MKDLLVKTVKDFLSLYWKPDRPMLLGYSGGPDSKALLYALLESRPHFNFELHLAHVDHGWRKESKTQAELLSSEAQNLGLSFHLLTVDPADFKQGNEEEQARKFRLKFFSNLYHALNCQALFLAHQAEDCAEVVLKRVCEGAHLFRLSGLTKCTQVEQMHIWRPFISIKKKQLIAWLNQRHLSFFIDETNESPRFLRGRMRTALFPFLTEGFGKEIVENFCSLSKMADQLKSYFSKKLSPHLDQIVSGPFGSYWEIPEHLENIEMEYVLKEWFGKEQIVISREVLQALVEKGKSGGIVRFFVKGSWIHVDRKRIFLLHQQINSNFLSSDWKLEVMDSELDVPSTWKCLWQGNMWGCVPKDNCFELRSLSLAGSYSGIKAAKEERRRFKVPGFLSNRVPLICSRNRVICDFLTGFNKLNKNYNKLNVIYIKLDLFNKRATN